jgi:hypothetical protein
MMTLQPYTAHDLVDFSDGKMRLALHPGQKRAWDSTKRFVVVLAGTQGGKTVFGPHWLLREIKLRGPGDYMVVTPTFPLLELKALPAFKRLFEKTLALGEYTGHPVRKFVFSESGSRRLFGDAPSGDTVIFFGHAQDPESLESATAKAAWLDEAGQRKFRLLSWEAIQRRLSVHEGRVLISTTPYDLSWIFQKLWTPWQQSNGAHPEIDVIRFDSTENPAFPVSEFERVKRELPRWRFDLFYRAIFTRPAGLIYDSFNPERHKIPRFQLPKGWRRYMGLDFGGVNTAGVYIAEDPISKNLYVYREYRPGRNQRDGAASKTAQQHVAAILDGEPGLPLAIGGSKSEQQWRDEFRNAGLPVMEPDIVEAGTQQGSSVEVGINRVYAAFARNEVYIFDDLRLLLDELASYSRETDSVGNVTEKIDDKDSFHGLDSLRYVLAHLRKPHDQKFEYGLPEKGAGSVVDSAPSGVFLPEIGKEKRFERNEALERYERRRRYHDEPW